MSGKWHLGFRDEHLPAARGFHQSFAFLPGCGNHFGWEPVYNSTDYKLPRASGHQPPLYVENGFKTPAVSFQDHNLQTKLKSFT